MYQSLMLCHLGCGRRAFWGLKRVCLIRNQLKMDESFQNTNRNFQAKCYEEWYAKTWRASVLFRNALSKCNRSDSFQTCLNKTSTNLNHITNKTAQTSVTVGRKEIRRRKKCLSAYFAILCDCNLFLFFFSGWNFCISSNE